MLIRGSDFQSLGVERSMGNLQESHKIQVHTYFLYIKLKEACASTGKL